LGEGGKERQSLGASSGEVGGLSRGRRGRGGAGGWGRGWGGLGRRVAVGMASACTVKDVSAHDFVRAYAVHLKRTGKMELPSYVDLIKTGPHKEMPPLDPDWYYMRAAAVARHVYVRQGVGVGAFRRIFGAPKNRGSRRHHKTKAAGGHIRLILRQLEQMRIVEKCAGGGRKVTSNGQRDLDRIAQTLKVRGVLQQGTDGLIIEEEEE